MEFGLSLGTNLGDRLANLVRARDDIRGLTGTRIAAQAAIWETEPVGVSPRSADNFFLNTVLIADCPLSPGNLSSALHKIESDMGRVRTEDRNAPRIIDIDIIYAEGLLISGPELIVPHPRWRERRFVVQPLADVRPELVLPGAGRPVREILGALPDSPAVTLFRRKW